MTDTPIVPVTPPNPLVPSADLMVQDDTIPAAVGAKKTDKKETPLDVLDQILNDAQAKAMNAAEEEAEKKAKEAEEARAQQKLEDAAKIQAELANLKTVSQSPQYQAMVEQEQEKVDEKQKQEEGMDGMHIVQLGHTKV